MNTREQDTSTSQPAEGAVSLLARARQHDPEALTSMFRQFLPASDRIIAAEYLGTQGLWGFGVHSFACVTDRRTAALRVKRFGEVGYQEAALEQINSGAVYQPSRLGLYGLVATLIVLLPGWGLLSVPVLGLLAGLLVNILIVLLLLPVIVRSFYRFKKSGLVLWVREGLAVYAFSDRKLLPRANALYRSALLARESRLAGV